MMSRTSRWLKWVGAGAVVLAVAPIAYADDARHTGSPASGAVAPHGSASTGTARAAGCGRGAADFAGAYLVAGASEEAADFHADGTVSVSAFGRPAAAGTWHADGDVLTWTAGAATYTARPGAVACADPAHPAQVSTFTAVAADGSADGSDSLTLQRF